MFLEKRLDLGNVIFSEVVIRLKILAPSLKNVRNDNVVKNDAVNVDCKKSCFMLIICAGDDSKFFVWYIWAYIYNIGELISAFLNDHFLGPF